jgi:hypothetical protein
MSFALSNIVIGSGSGTAIKDSGTALSSLGGSSYSTGVQGQFNSTNYPTTPTTTWAHNLGKTPSKVEFTMVSVMNTQDPFGLCNGCYTASSQSCVNIKSINGTISQIYQDASYAIYVYDDASRYIRGLVSVSSTNITITWSKSTGTPTSTNFNILWRASG